MSLGLHSGNPFMVTVARGPLLKTLKDNLTRHNQIVKEAKEGYTKKLLEIYEKHLKQLKNGKVPNVGELMITRPEDHSAEYTTAIEMLELATTENVELGSPQFKSFVKDEWDWQRGFLHSSFAYSSTANSLVETSNTKGDDV